MKIARSALSDAYTVSRALHASVKITSTYEPLPTRSIHAGRRTLHSSPPKDVAIPLSPSASPASPQPTSSPETVAKPLAHLPLSQILRTYFITSISSSPALLGASTSILHHMLESRNPLLRIDSNPILRAILWETFYKQFCAGEDPAQVSKTCTELRQQGYAGVILEYALEVLKDADGDEPTDVATWRQGMLDTITIAAPGDFVGLKWSGMGAAAMRRMKHGQDPSPAMRDAMHAVCGLAAAKRISLLPAAEESWSLDGFHAWCLDLQRAYNLRGRSVVYTTYQAYLRQTPATLARHLALAEREGFTLGAKLVRGAYLATERRDLIHPSIDATHAAYDALMSALLRRGYNETLRPDSGLPSGGGRFPELNFVIASHNAVSVRTAREIRRGQFERGEELTPTVFAQLQGMADEVSCELIAADGTGGEATAAGLREKVLKCTTWGSMYQCLNYLLRRAAENKDAASRTEESRNAMQAELMRRWKGRLGFSG